MHSFFDYASASGLVYRVTIYQSRKKDTPVSLSRTDRLQLVNFQFSIWRAAAPRVFCRELADSNFYDSLAEAESAARSIIDTFHE